MIASLVVSALTLMPAAGAADVRGSTVKILVTQRAPDAQRPWNKQPPAEISGSGVVIDGHRILTNAHVVRYATQVRVQPDKSSSKLPAKVTAIGVGIDLAVLTLEDATFFDTHPAAPLADALPKIGAKVEAIGFPVGGETLSVTEGSVSRIDFVPYAENTQGLRIQVDAAINPGNSGGPAVVDDQVVGLCFSGLRNADNIGFVIPVEEIRTFLADVADGSYDGKPRFGAQLQTLENEALRAKLGLPKGVTGMMFTRVPRGPAHDVLHEWDVITKIGPHSIDNDGRVTGDDGLRLSWHYWVQKLAQDGQIPVTLVRDGVPIEIQLPAPAKSDKLIKSLGNRYPSYFLWGPLVFSPVYSEYVPGLVNAVGGDGSPIVKRMNDECDEPGEELVMLCSSILEHRISEGYDAGPFSIVGKVNGIEIKSLKQLVETLKNVKDEFVVFEFADHGTETVVLRRADVEAAQEEILESNTVRSQCSPDLEKAWKGE